MQQQPLVIDYYSDVLCIWSWIAQRRNDELKEQWGDQVKLKHHYLNLFGSVEKRMTEQWHQRGGIEGFADYVQAAAAPFEQAPVNTELWRKNAPQSSLNAHLLIKSCEQQYGEMRSEELAFAIRSAFYNDVQDVGSWSLLYDISHQLQLNNSKLQKAIDDGSAAAALMADYQKAETNQIKGSPSWVLDNGRQTLYGNVGYRVLHANIEELLRKPKQEASWC